MGVRSSFWLFVIKRLGISVFLLWGVATIMFLAARLVPGDVISVMLGEEAAADPVARQAMIERFGLDRPVPEQYYLHMTNLVQGDFGISMRTRGPVADELARAVPASLELGILAGLISAILGIFLGTLSALQRGKLADQLIRVVTVTGISVPLFWLALVALYVFSFKLQMFPGIGRLSPGVAPPPTATGMYTIDALLAGQLGTFADAFMHLLIPGAVLAVFTMTLITRFTRSAVLEVLNEDYVRTARAKGLTSVRILFAHVLRAAFVPIVTVIGIMFGAVLAGAVLVEEIFNFPGIGQMMFRSAVFLDMPGMIGIGLVVAVIYVGISFVTDILYGVIDPRIRVS
ncbi:ABC transporter permease [Ruania rhizosphaerae]|uniref:ABC transporter permease n=1 Tax=Ruania rhizosphaerae TaxID=1840413 RepID=UPI001357B28D|nr:ABC transporter permease [Ruania rhizosphaerae]